MTVAVSPTSARYVAAQRFGRELDRAMRERKVGRRKLAAALGMSSASIIAHWRGGNGVPTVANAALLAEVLDCDALLTIARGAREGNCLTCGKGFVNEGGSQKRFCSERCREVKAKVRSGQDTRLRADVAERRLGEHRSAVEAFCQSCEPEGHCHDAECALRSVSPLPLVEMRRTA